jgi:hypothetical protein
VAVRRKATVAAVTSIAAGIAVETVAAIADAADGGAAEAADVVVDAPAHRADGIFLLRNMPRHKAANAKTAATNPVAGIAVALISAARAVTSAAIGRKAADRASPAHQRARPVVRSKTKFFSPANLWRSSAIDR